MEKKDFWQMQNCGDIFHNTKGLPKNLTCYFGSEKHEKLYKMIT